MVAVRIKRLLSSAKDNIQTVDDENLNLVLTTELLLEAEHGQDCGSNLKSPSPRIRLEQMSTRRNPHSWNLLDVLKKTLAIRSNWRKWKSQAKSCTIRFCHLAYRNLIVIGIRTQRSRMPIVHALYEYERYKPIGSPSSFIPMANFRSRWSRVVGHCGCRR